MRPVDGVAELLLTSEINQPSGRAVRPLGWLHKQGHDDAIPEVWQMACTEAGGPPTEGQVKHALKHWKDEHGYKVQRAGATGLEVSPAGNWARAESVRHEAGKSAPWFAFARGQGPESWVRSVGIVLPSTAQR